MILRKKEDYKKRISRKTIEFSDGMQAVSFALNTGYSIENAYAEAVGELQLLYGDNSSIVKDFRMIVNRIRRNENLEDVMDDYAARMNIADISYFRGDIQVCQKKRRRYSGYHKTDRKDNP